MQFAGGELNIISASGQRLLTSTLDSLRLEAADTDGDGIDDFNDNCTSFANEDQRDTDGDGFGNACDPDFNNNGVVDVQDFSRLKSALGSDDAPDQDLNGNGIVDVLDFSTVKSMLGKPPGPSAVGML